MTSTLVPRDAAISQELRRFLDSLARSVSGLSGNNASDTEAGIIELATQAEMETATDVATAVTPGRTQYHPGVAKAWGAFTAADGTLLAGHNATVVRDSTGDYTVTLGTDMSSTSYAILLSYEAAAGFHVRLTSRAAGSFTIKAINLTLSDADPTSISFACYGDQ